MDDNSIYNEEPINPSASLDTPVCWMPHKRGEMIQCWYMFDTRKECAEWIRTNRHSFKGFKPKRYILTASRKRSGRHL